MQLTLRTVPLIVAALLIPFGMLAQVPKGEGQSYEKFKSTYSSEGRQFGLANKAVVFGGVILVEMAAYSDSCGSFLELRPAQKNAIAQRLADTPKSKSDEFFDPNLGHGFEDVLDLSQQAKLSALALSQEGLLAVRYHFVIDEIGPLHDEANKQFKALVEKYFNGEPMKYLEIMTSKLKGVDATKAKQLLREHAESFDRAVWLILTDKQKNRLGRLPAIPPGFVDKCRAEVVEKLNRSPAK